jgi:Glycosyltransferase family 87
LLFAVLSTFGLSVFAATLTAVGFASLYVIAGRWAWALLFFPPVWWDLSAANASTLIGAAVAVGPSRPGLFAIPLLTKVTPGVTVLWFAFRREWRSLAVAIATTGPICAASALIAPQLWLEWITGLVGNNPGYAGPGFFSIQVPVLPRLLVAVPLLAWAALTNRVGLLPVIAFLATPVLWYTTAATLAAVEYRRRVASNRDA